MKKVLSIIVSLVLVFGLNAQNLTITGKVINNRGDIKKIWLQNLLTRQKLAESEIKSDGSFTIKTNISKTDYFGLSVADRQYLFLVLSPGENVSVIYDLNNSKNSVVKGSKETQVIFDSYKYDQQIDEKLQECQNKAQKEKMENYKKLVESNLGNIATIIIAQQLPMDEYFDTHKKLAKSLEKYRKDNNYVNQYVSSVYAYEKTGIGKVAPDIALQDTSGKVVKLSSLRGKYVLVDFWAAWCRPCRAESPNLVAAYNKYKGKGFTIYSVSLDRTKAAWINAIKADKLGQWTHVSDLKGWQSSAAELYGVNAIPANFLLDKDGKIIAKNLRGEELEKKLSEIFDK